MVATGTLSVSSSAGADDAEEVVAQQLTEELHALG